MSFFISRIIVYIYIFLSGIFFSSNALAAGITIPANCTLDVASCALIVSGDVNNSGTLRTSTGSITTSGNWISSGVFTSGTGTVTFNGTSGTQILNTGGLANAFYNLTHNGASTLSLSTNVLDINNTFTQSAGTLQSNNLNLTLGKDWINTGTFTPGTSTVTLDGTNQTITGITSFYNLTKITATADTLTFSADGADEQTVTHLLTLNGAIGQLLSLEKSGANAQAKLKLQTGGAQIMRYLSVHNNQATGMTLVAGLTSTNAGNNTNWSFGNGTFTWDGVSSTDWDDPFNWSGGVVPAPGDSVTIQPVGGTVVYAPILSTNVTIANLTLQANSVLDLSGRNMTITNTFTNSGNVRLKGNETLNFTQDTVNPGTFTYYGTNTGTTITIRDFGASDYYNLVINDTNGTPDTFITNGALTTTHDLTVTAAVLNTSTNSNAVTVAGTLTVNGGTLTATNSTIDANGAVVISSGTLTAPSSTANTAFTVAGDWTHSGGTFTANSGKVTLDGTNQTMVGSTTFYQLRKVVAAAATLTLTAGTTQTITNNLVMNGVVGNVLTIVSSVGGSVANLNLQAGGTQALSYMTVSDNTASGITLVASAGGVNGGNNTNWIFGGATMTWTGTTSTDWDTNTNWDLGIVPTSFDSAVIANVSNQPVLATNVSVVNLTTNASSNLTLNGKNLTSTGTFTNNGNITLFGTETLSFVAMDTAHGTFTYVGNGDGVVDTITVQDFGATDYYSLTINDTHGTKDLFITNANLNLTNNLTVSSSALNTSTNSNSITLGGTLTVNGGTLTTTNSTIDANGAVLISSGTFIAPSSTTNTGFTVAGNWTYSGGTFTNSNGKVTLDGTSQTMAGSSTFYQLRKVVAAADTLTLTAGTTQTITNDITLSGATGQVLSLRSTVNSSQANLSLSALGTQSINYMDVKDNNATGLTLIARNSSVNSGNNTNWVFGGATITWTGTTSTDWDLATNWDLGIVPNSDDTAIVTNVANAPLLSTNTSLTTLTVNASSTLTLNGKNITVSGVLTNNGTVSLFGSETMSYGTMDVAHGTFVYTGNGDGVVDTFTLHDFGATDYFNLVINDTHGTKDLFITNGNLTTAGTLNVTSSSLNISTNTNTLTTAGTLTVDGGTLTATNGNIDANGTVVISSGTLTAPTTGKTFTVAGSWTHSGGTFTHSSGRVTMDTTTTATMTGDTTFYDWYSTTANKQFIFTAASNQTVNNLFNFVGASGSPITLRSSTPTSTWSITTTGLENTVSQIDVEDSIAVTNRIVCLECTDSGNNTNWRFVRLALNVPADQRTVGQLPVIIGTGPSNTNIRIKGLNEAGVEVNVATTRSDADGNYRVVVGQDNDTDNTTSVAAGLKLRISTSGYDNYLQPNILNSSSIEVPGPANTLEIVANPTKNQVPQITSPTNNQRVRGDLPMFVGNGKASLSVAVWGSDSDGNLLISNIGSSTTDTLGYFAFPITTALKKGTNYLSVVVDGVSSDLITVYLTDPYGVVFDSTTGNPIQDAVVSLYRVSDGQLAEKSSCDINGNITTLRDIDCNDTNPYTTAADGQYSFLAANADYYMVTSNGDFIYPSTLSTFPPGKVVTTGSKGENFTVNSVILQIDHPVDINKFLLRIEKTANKTEVRIGDVITYTVTIQNLSSTDTVNNIVLVDRPPPGFKYLNNRVLLDGVAIPDPVMNRQLNFVIGTIAGGVTKTLKYQLVVGAGVSTGTYENVAQARYANNLVISNSSTKSVKVVMDPLFDLGTIIGKVFYDLNENGIQDAPEYDPTEGTTIVEKPVGNVQIATEDGTLITTDREGKYTWPGVLPGRHMLRIDERTLPAGAYLTTDKAVVVDVTNGSISKVNFGVNMDNKQIVGKDAVFFNEKIALNQDKNKPAPRLNVALFTPEDDKENVTLYNNAALFRPAQFRIFTNYAPFIDKWRLEIIDADTRKLIKHYDGTKYNIHDAILWNGKGDDERIIRVDHRYAYVLSVTNEEGQRDTTTEKPIQIKTIETEEEYKKEKERVSTIEWEKKQAESYRKWVEVQGAVNNLDRRGIIVAGETIRINRQGQDIKAVRILKDGVLFAELPMEQYFGLTPKELLEAGITTTDKPSNVEIILPNGDYNLEVIGPKGANQESDVRGANDVMDGNLVPSPMITPIPNSMPSPVGLERYTRPLKVGDDYFMFVGLGDAKAGYNLNRGNVEPIQSSDNFHNKFWHEGKAAYYLKGKIQGKYLVTSSFDTDRQQKELYRKLDPATFYPVYGDQSSINYDATDTQGPLYLMVQWDKSQAVWGNYAVDFKDTEFANFTRSYYGGKLDYQSLSNNSYGDARTKVVLFHAEVQQRPNHNEFLGTGGSLYFLKNKDVVQGTDKIRLEVRDKITGLVLSSKEMKQGSDYELDEGQGRILFWQPVSMIAKAESIITSTLTDGNPVYVVADYEYYIQDKILEASEGGRVAQGIGDNVVVGGTYVKETQADKNFALQGTDVTAHLGPDATVKAEFAKTQSTGISSYVSTDGGITFTQLQSGDASTGEAFGIRGDARLFNRLGVSTYYKWIEDSFTSVQASSQQGKEMLGLALTFDLTPVTRLTAKTDIQKLINNGNLQTVAQVGASETSTTLVQVVHETERLKLTGAYQIQEVKDKIGDIVTQTNQVTKALAGKAEYALNGRVTVTAGQQFDINDPTKNVTTIGAEGRVTDRLKVSAQESFSQEGTATTVGATQNVTDKLAFNTSYTMAQFKTGQMDKTTTFGAEQKFNENITANAGVTMTDSSTGTKTTSGTVGTKAKVKLNEGTELEAVVGKTADMMGRQFTTAAVTGTTALGLDKDATIKTALAVDLANGGGQTKTMAIDATKHINDNLTTTSSLKVDENAQGGKTTTIAMTDQAKISERLQAVSEKAFTINPDGSTTNTKYGLTRNQDGKALEASVTRTLGDDKSGAVTQSNIFGLTGDVNDKLALQGSLEKGSVQNLDGSRTDRTAITMGAGYVWKDPELAIERLKDSAKIEFRFDNGNENKRQFVFYNALEGKVTDNMSVSAKVEFSRTENVTTNTIEQRHQQIILGAAYRPVNFDRLNLIAQYAYTQNAGPIGQSAGTALDVERNVAQVFGLEGVYDVNESWQLAEKFAIRINDEKVTGFAFNRTHTWLMIHRINYKLDRDWTLSSELRNLTQVEAKDSKQGVLLEATRNINDNAQLGLGWNFTQFNDDLTNLNYTSQGPFVRMSGKLYDRSPAEKQRAREKWLDNKVSEWAWAMVSKELQKPDSKVVADLNHMFAVASAAQKQKKLAEAQQIYKDIIMAGQMMFDEASEFIRTQIAYEEKLQQYNKTAEDYYRSGEYLKARKLWEKIVADAQKGVIQ